MPRRFLATRQRVQSAVGDRLRAALVYELERPGTEQLIGSQDQKLLLVKSSFLATGGPLKLIATPPEHLTSISDIPSPSLPITSEPNPYSHLNELGGEGTEVDFTRVEDFFQLETQIDAKKDHSIVKIALTSPDGTFLNDLISSYALPSQRLAFIQQMSHSALSVQQNSFVVTPGQDKELIVSCQVCGEMFSYLHKFQRHILTHSDPENKKFLCQVCGKRFNRADHLNRHSILHGEVLHKCLLCGEEFDRASHLDRHRRKNHPPAGQAPSQTPPLTPQLTYPSGNSPQSAGLEDTSLGTNLHLLASVATPEDTQELTPEEILQMEANKVVSQILISDISSEQRETAKKNLAAVERPFVCEVCGRKFIRSTHLRRHIRIHTGEKPFACHICGRRYARGDYLRAHIHAHRRDRVHKCKHCSEIFHDLTRFADHCRLLHKDVEDEYGNIQEPPITPSDPPDGFMLCDDAEVSVNTIESVAMTDPSSPIPIVAVSMDRGQSRRLNDVMSSFGTGDSLSSQFSTTELLHAFTSATSTQPDSQIIFQNGNLSIPETGNEVTVLTGKVGHGAMLESLTHLFMTGSGTSIDVLGSTDHSH